MKTITIVGAVLDTKSFTLYIVKDGRSGQLNIPQGDKRLQPLLDAILPQLNATGSAAINAEMLETSTVSAFTEMEKKTNGFVRFFAIARSKLKALLGDGVVEGKPQVFGHIPPTQQEVVAAIMAQAEPISDKHELEAARPLVNENQHTDNTHPAQTSEHTVVAVVGETGIVPNVELLQGHFNHAIINTAKGTQALLERMAAMQVTRKHSVQDLLTFLERADIPIMDDGSLLVYKMLASAHDTFANVPTGQDIFVDIHSRKVPQWVGAMVRMDPSLVNDDRRIECSYGLHIARRGYLRNFSGDVCVLAKVLPEDVIAVPQYDANKIRVCAYHILHQLSNAHKSMVVANRHLTADVDGQALLGRLLAGNFAPPTHEVVLGDAAANSITIHNLANPQVVTPAKEQEVSLVHALPDDVTTLMAPHVNVKALVQKTRKELAAELNQKYQVSGSTEDLAALMELKKKTKISWENLGIPDPMQAKPVVPVLAKKPIKVAAKKKIPTANTQPLSQKEKMVWLLDTLSPETARQILDIKKKSKKAWAVLGVPAELVEIIQQLAQK